MKSCAFIGHKSVSRDIETILETRIKDLITEKETGEFYVGNNGGFDLLVQKVLKKLKKQYSWMEYRIVLAYIPTKREDYKDYSDTVYPEGLERVPKRYAIIERNKWMIKRSDFLICYVEHTFSNANKFKEFAEKKGKTVFNLFDDLSE